MRHEFELRPCCAMSQVVALPLVCSLGVSDAAPGSLVRWPSGVVRADGTVLANVAVGVRYDQGLVATVAIDLADEADAHVVEGAVRARVDAWGAALTSRTAPLAPNLGELFDRLWLMGSPVEALLPDGQAFATGTLAGIDLWGRVTVLVDGRELELAPEQASLRPHAMG